MSFLCSKRDLENQINDNEYKNYRGYFPEEDESYIQLKPVKEYKNYDEEIVNVLLNIKKMQDIIKDIMQDIKRII